MLRSRMQIADAACFGVFSSAAALCALAVGVAAHDSTPTRFAARIPASESTQVPKIQQFRIPTRRAGATGITVDAQGRIWFTEELANKIACFTPSSREMVEYLVPIKGAQPDNITVGPDENIWFTQGRAPYIGRLTPGVGITEVPDGSHNPAVGIVSGPDGNLWFTAEGIGRMTVQGSVSYYAIPWQKSWPQGITVGPDGALWFADYGANSIGRVTTAEAFTQYEVPNPLVGLHNIVSGPDGALWFSEELNSAIGRITTAGNISSVVTSGGVRRQLTCPPALTHRKCYR